MRYKSIHLLCLVSAAALLMVCFGLEPYAARRQWVREVTIHIPLNRQQLSGLQEINYVCFEQISEAKRFASMIIDSPTPREVAQLDFIGSAESRTNGWFARVREIGAAGMVTGRTFTHIRCRALVMHLTYNDGIKLGLFIVDEDNLAHLNGHFSEIY